MCGKMAQTPPRRATKQISISLPPEMHKEFTDLAEKLGLSLSALIRLSIWEFIQKQERGGVPEDVRRLVFETEGINQKISRLDERVGSQNEITKELINQIRLEKGGDKTSRQEDMNRIFQPLVESTEPQTIPDIVDATGLRPDRVREAMDALQNEARVNRIPPKDVDEQVTKWEILR